MKQVFKYNGLRLRPTFDELVNYVEHDQDIIKYPDRIARLMREHPYLTQLDSEGMFEIQDQQDAAMKDQLKDMCVRQLASQTSFTAHQLREMMNDKGAHVQTLSNKEFDDLYNSRKLIEAESQSRKARNQEKLHTFAQTVWLKEFNKGNSRGKQWGGSMDRAYSSPGSPEEDQGGQPSMPSIGPATPYQPSASSAANVPFRSPASSSTTPLQHKIEIDTPVKKLQFEPTPKSESLQPSPKKEETPEQKATRKILNFMPDAFLGEGKKAEPEDEYMTQFSYQPPT